MTTSPTTIRLLTVLFFLAGLLLLKKPVFGQTVTAAPARVSIVNSPREPVPAQTLSLEAAVAQAGFPGARYTPGSAGSRPRTSHRATSRSDR
jgi:hypothetical protein